MTVKIFLWDEDEWIDQAGKQLFKAKSGYYEKLAGALIEYIIVSKESVAAALAACRADESRRMVLAVGQLNEEKVRLLKEIEQHFPHVTILVKGKGAFKNAGGCEAMKRWIYVPVLDRELLEGALKLIASQRELWQMEELIGRTVLLGKAPLQSHAAEIMMSLFKNWQFIEQCHHVSLKLFSPEELDGHILCEIEDAAYQYLAEKSYFQAVSIAIDKVSPDIYYVLEAF